MSVGELCQAIYQDKPQFFDRYGVTHVRSVHLYFTPCDERGQPVLIADEFGNPIGGYETAGAYQSAADAYLNPQVKPQNLEPRTLLREPTHVPFSPL